MMLFHSAIHNYVIQDDGGRLEIEEFGRNPIIYSFDIQAANQTLLPSFKPVKKVKVLHGRFKRHL